MRKRGQDETSGGLPMESVFSSGVRKIIGVKPNVSKWSPVWRAEKFIQNVNQVKFSPGFKGR